MKTSKNKLNLLVIPRKRILTLLTLLTFFITSSSLVSAQTIDDFSNGTFSTRTYSTGQGTPFYQNVSTVAGGVRMFKTVVRQDPFIHNIQLTLRNGLLAMTTGYEVRGKIFLNYGKGQSGPSPLNLDLSQAATLKVEFEGHSTISGIYVRLVSSDGSVSVSKKVPASEGSLIFEIGLDEFESNGSGFNDNDVDALMFQFDSNSQTGCNAAITRIWFE